MSKPLFKIFILIAGLFYLQAAFEVNTENIKNTWGDEYDTYVHADNSNSVHFYKGDQGKILISSIPSSFSIQIPLNKPEMILTFTDGIDSPPPKLFIAFHSLLI